MFPSNPDPPPTDETEDGEKKTPRDRSQDRKTREVSRMQDAQVKSDNHYESGSQDARDAPGSPLGSRTHFAPHLSQVEESGPCMCGSLIAFNAVESQLSNRTGIRTRVLRGAGEDGYSAVDSSPAVVGPAEDTPHVSGRRVEADKPSGVPSNLTDHGNRVSQDEAAASRTLGSIDAENTQRSPLSIRPDAAPYLWQVQESAFRDGTTRKRSAPHKRQK